MKKKQSLKLVSVLLVALGTLYPPLELTRLIFWQFAHPYYFISYRVQQYWELGIFWGCWLAAQVLVYKMTDSDGLTDPWNN